MIEYDYFLIRQVRIGEDLTLRGTWCPIKDIFESKGKNGLSEWLETRLGKYPDEPPKLLYKLDPRDYEKLESKTNAILQKSNSLEDLSKIEEQLSQISELTKVSFDEPYTRFKLMTSKDR